tara:strand:- start:2042 stop:3910 length:1869 start_codon:yes stop_codon:yes gene_type:complete
MNEGILRAITQSSNSSSTPETDKLQAAMYNKALAAQNFAIKQAKDRSKINFDAQIKADAEVQELIAGITLKDENDKDFNSGIDINTLPNSLKSMTSSLSSAKVRVENGTATQEDKDYISATTVFIGNLGESFGTMAYTLEEYKKTNEKYGGQIDTPGAVDQYTLNPNYANSVRILDGSASGKVFFEIEYKNGKQNLTQVAQSEDIRKENKRLYDLAEGTKEKKQYLNENGEISDKYKLSYNKARDFQNNQNQNEFVISDEFSTIPDGNTVTKALTEEGGIYDKSNGLLKKDFMKPIPTQQIRTINGQRVVIDKTSPDVNLISSRAKIEAQVFTRKMFGGARNEPFSAFTRVSAPIFGKEGKDWQLDEEGDYNVRLLKKDVDGNYEMNEDGTYKKESKLTKIGSKDLTNARFNMMSSVGGKYLGMSKEDYDLANRFVQDASMINLNLTQASTEKINEDATKKLNEEPKIQPIAEQKQSLINERTSSIIKRIGDLDQISNPEPKDYESFNNLLKKEIRGLKGMDVVIADKANMKISDMFTKEELDEINSGRQRRKQTILIATDPAPVGTAYFSKSTTTGQYIDSQSHNVTTRKGREAMGKYIETVRGVLYGDAGKTVLEKLSKP